MADATRPSNLPAAQAGAVYGPLLRVLLTDEMARKASLEQRALAVISTSGGLVTLVLALAALLLGKDTSMSPGWPSRALMVIAVGAFVSAAVTALFANRPSGYLGFANADVDRMLDEWQFSQTEAEVLVAGMYAERFKTASDLNGRKAMLIQVAVSFAVLGVVLLSAAVVAALLR